MQETTEQQRALLRAHQSIRPDAIEQASRRPWDVVVQAPRGGVAGHGDGDQYLVNRQDSARPGWRVVSLWEVRWFPASPAMRKPHRRDALLAYSVEPECYWPLGSPMRRATVATHFCLRCGAATLSGSLLCGVCLTTRIRTHHVAADARDRSEAQREWRSNP